MHIPRQGQIDRNTYVNKRRKNASREKHRIIQRTHTGPPRQGQKVNRVLKVAASSGTSFLRQYRLNEQKAPAVFGFTPIQISWGS